MIITGNLCLTLLFKNNQNNEGQGARKIKTVFFWPSNHHVLYYSFGYELDLCDIWMTSQKVTLISRFLQAQQRPGLNTIHYSMVWEILQVLPNKRAIWTLLD